MWQKNKEVRTYDLSSEDKIVISEVANPEDEREFLVPERDDRLGAEDNCLLSQLGSRQLREHQPNHESLDQTSQDGL